MRRFVVILCVAAAAALFVFTRTAASLLLLCAVLLLPIVLWILASLVKNAVQVSIEVPTGVHKNTAAQILINFENSSPVPVMMVELTLTIHNIMTGRQSEQRVACAIAPRGTMTVGADFESAVCGQHVIYCDELRIYDALGLRGIRRPVELNEKLVVLPDTFSTEVSITGRSELIGDGETFSVARKGQNYTDPLQIRTYVEGDSPKQIHWKLSYKLGQYMVTDPSLELNRALLLLLDSGALPPDASVNVPDALAEAVVSVCMPLADAEIPFCVAWKNSETGNIITKEVNTEDDVFDVISGVLGIAPGTRRASLLPEFLCEFDASLYPTIVSFGYGLPPAGDYADGITALVCSESELSDGGASLATVMFTPENYRDVLRRITF